MTRNYITKYKNTNLIFILYVKIEIKKVKQIHKKKSL